MARIVLVTGGSRSGKSSYAQELAEQVGGPRVFIATCPVIDDEMAERVRRHRDRRDKATWDTIEETTDLAVALRRANGHGVVLVDCLTVWIANLMHEAERRGGRLTEDDMAGICREVVDVCTELSGAAIFVTNEVGLGIVPDNAPARRYRDLVGRCNQILADAADEVTLVVCGIPMDVKQRSLK